MRLAVIKSRLALVDVRGAIDVEAASAGRFSPDPQAIYEQWAQFSAWYAAASETIRTADATPYSADELGAPVPEPRQVFAVVPLLPGDLIFTGTPAGIGWARDPKVVLRPGDRLVTHAEAIGEMTTTFTAA
jgi:hypothetical protein